MCVCACVRVRVNKSVFLREHTRAFRHSTTPWLLAAFLYWIGQNCQFIAAEGHYTHCGMQTGWRKIQSPNDSVGTVPPVGSERDTWMQAYTRRLLLARYHSHMLWMNAQRSLRPLPVDGAQGSNRCKTNPMRGSPNDHEKRTVPMDETDSSIQIYHPIFSSDDYESIVALEIALQLVFDHAKSQLPEEVCPRVIQRWQFRSHGDNLNSGRPAVAGSVCTVFYTATHEIRQPERVSGGATKRGRCDQARAARPSAGVARE